MQSGVDHHREGVISAPSCFKDKSLMTDLPWPLEGMESPFLAAWRADRDALSSVSGRHRVSFLKGSQSQEQLLCCWNQGSKQGQARSQGDVLDRMAVPDTEWAGTGYRSQLAIRPRRK